MKTAKREVASKVVGWRDNGGGKWMMKEWRIGRKGRESSRVAERGKSEWVSDWAESSGGWREG